MSLLNLFTKPKPPQERIVFIQRDVCHIAIDQWRQDKDLVKNAMKLLRDPLFLNLMDVTRGAHPLNIVNTDQIPLEERAIMQARGEGYTMALHNLESLGVYIAPFNQLEATYEPPQQPIQPEPEEEPFTP